VPGGGCLAGGRALTAAGNLDLPMSYYRRLPDGVVVMHTRPQRAPQLKVIAAPQTIFIRTALSSDAPVVSDDNPLTGMMAAVTRIDEEGELIAPREAITATEALPRLQVDMTLVAGRVAFER